MSEHLPAGDAATEQRQLITGVNASLWPDMKIQRAAVHLSELHGRFMQWESGKPYRTQSRLRPDRRTIDTYLRIHSVAPLDEWSLILGDFLHNLRSALDAIAWELATFNGASPRKPKSVQFPIATDPSAWDIALTGWVGDLPSAFIERLSLLQPFRYAVAGKLSALEVLHALDIQDKHKSALEVGIGQEGIELRGSFRLVDAAATLRPNWTPVQPLDLHDGALVLTMAGQSDIYDDLSLYAPLVVPRLNIGIQGKAEMVSVPEMSETLLTEVRRYIEIIRVGFTEDEKWVPADITDPQAAT